MATPTIIDETTAETRHDNTTAINRYKINNSSRNRSRRSSLIIL